MKVKSDIIEEIKKLPYTAISHSNMLWNKTGTWRYVKPVYENKLAICTNKCPCGNDIANFLLYASRGEFQKGYEIIKKTNPFPGVCGRVCYHPCEMFCNRAQFDIPVAIQAIERFLADYVYENEKIVPDIAEKKNKRIAIIGSGPAGLSCAYHLALKGYSIEVFEAYDKSGGMLRYGIPSYRLPKDILDREINTILEMGINLKTNTKIGVDFSLNNLEGYDAVYIATGAHKSRSLGIKGENNDGIISGLEFLSKINSGEKISLGEKVVVIGGGNTAIDAARSVVRSGSEVTIVYRRSKNEMPAWDKDVEDAIEEGIKFVFLASPAEIISEDNDVKGITFQKMELGEPDQSGRRKPVPIENSYFKIDADNVIVAIGEDSETSFLNKSFETKDRKIVTTPYYLTNIERYFAGGDVSFGIPATVASAIGSGKQGAESIDYFLKNEKNKAIKERKITEFKDLNLDYFTPSIRINIPKLNSNDRISNFYEIVRTVSPEEVIFESERCFSCGLCTMCDNCVIFCPDLVIRRKDDNSGYNINYDYCKGCGICIEECPRNAISVEKEIKIK